MNTDDERLLDLIESLHLAYPEATFGWRGSLANVVDLWRHQLGDLPIEAIEAAVTRWIATHPKLPHISDIRSLLAEAVNPLPSEGEVWGKRNRYFRGDVAKEPFANSDDVFAYQVFASIGNPRDLGQMDEAELRRAVGFAYRRLAEGERTERTATVGELRGIGDSGLRAIS